MRKILVLLILVVSVFGCAKNSKILTSDIEVELSKRFTVGADNITARDINLDKFYEVTFSTGEVFYSDRKGENLIIGRLVNKDNEDLTGKKEAELNKIKVQKLESELDLKKAIRIGNGNIKVIEFTDVDCPFCYKAEEFFKDSDVSRYIFFTPLDELHPDAAAKSVHILCADNKALAYERIINNLTTKFSTCTEGEELLKAHREYGKAAGVTGTPHFIINSKIIMGADPKIKIELGK